MDPSDISSSFKSDLALTKTTAVGISAAGGMLARTSDVTALRRVIVYSSANSEKSSKDSLHSGHTRGSLEHSKYST